MEKLNFSNCTLDILESSLGVRRVNQSNGLDNWLLASDAVLQTELLGSLKLFVRNLTFNVEHWNEQDLSLHFIGPMFSLVGFTEPYRFNLFAQSNLEGDVGNYRLSGRVDELVATGYRSPKIPFFAFSEYKKETAPDGDPAGQTLGAMLVGQALNQKIGKDLAIYGCYIVGSVWKFMILEGKHYAISSVFDATNYEDACQILKILLQLKTYCMENTKDLV